MKNIVIDYKIAEKVMGWVLKNDNTRVTYQASKVLNKSISFAFDYYWDTKYSFYKPRPKDWRPSESMTDIWKVINKVRSNGFLFYFAEEDNKWRASFADWKNDVSYSASDISWPKAVCGAALKTVGYKI